MSIILTVLQFLVIFLGPLFILFLTKHVKPLGFLGPIFLCYAFGVGMSFIFKALNSDMETAVFAAEAMIPIAIPLILFSVDFSSLRKLAKPMLISFLLVIISVFTVSSGAFFAFGDSLGKSFFDGDTAGVADLNGMLIGLYTGGTPNLNAIGAALGVGSNAIALSNACDVTVGGIYFLLLLMVGPIIARKNAAEESNGFDSELEQELTAHFSEEYSGGFLRRIPAVLLAVGCLGIGVLLSLLITGKPANDVVLMLTVTTLGLAFSFFKKVRTAPGTFSSGQYLIYVFSVGIGMSFDLSAFDSGALELLLYIGAVQFGSVLLHFILSAIFRIKAPTAVITSVAGIFGPAFIVPIANTMKKREVVLPGLICGILGYAIGNYLGIGTAMLLKLFT